MKIVTASNGKKKIKISKSEWTSAGEKAGWIVAQQNPQQNTQQNPQQNTQQNLQQNLQQNPQQQQIDEKAINLILQSQDPELKGIVDLLRKGDVSGASREYLRVVKNIQIANSDSEIVTAGKRAATKKTVSLLWTLFSIAQLFASSPDLDQKIKSDLENASDYLKKQGKILESEISKRTQWQKQTILPQMPQPQIA